MAVVVGEWQTEETANEHMRTQQQAPNFLQTFPQISGVFTLSVALHKK